MHGTLSEKEYLLNNLGYCFYKQKRYSEAKDLFEECLRINIDLSYTANNYIQVLVTLGKYGDVKNVKKGKFCTSKALRNKVEKLSDSNTSLKKDVSEIIDKEKNRRASAGTQGSKVPLMGRLDLLCEDDSGNLYIKELKKDIGYDDVYKRLSGYLKWFEESEKFKDRKTYGIICLNNPSKELIAKVHADKRMRIYEYPISYIWR